MHVTRVELENIKSYERAAFSFERGTTAIVGANGAGKTTILESIAWTLFDVLDYKKDDFVRRGAKKGTVRVTFESDLDKRQYTVVRDTGTGYFVFDPALQARIVEKKADVGAFLRQHLGIEAGTDLQALFRSAIGVPQGTLTSDFLKTAAERKTAFDRLLKVEEYSKSAERLRETLRLINERLTEARERIAGAEGRLARYDEIAAEQMAAAQRVEELARALDALQSQAAESERVVQQLDESEQRVNETRAERERLAIERAAGARRVEDLRVEVEAATLAAERQRATESDYQTHLRALAELRELEERRAERDELRAKSGENERALVRTESELRRLADALASSESAAQRLRELEPQIIEQEFHEQERERLRDLLAQANAASGQLARLDSELETLRARHKQTSEQVKLAESARGARERVESLEIERFGVETELSKVEQAKVARKHLNARRQELTREIARLRASIATLERAVEEIEKRINGAGDVSEIELRFDELKHEAARLRAEIARDEKMRAEVKNGLCPILSERCLNIPEGQTLETYFKDHLATNRAQMAQIESETKLLGERLRYAREAALAAARLSSEQARLAQERAALAEREEMLAAVEKDLAEQTKIADAFKDLSGKLAGIDAVLKNLREDDKRFAALETLREHLREIESEGKAKKAARADLEAIAGGAPQLEKDLSETEKKLRALNDPRGRAAALRVEAERTVALRAEEFQSRARLNELEAQRRELTVALQRFDDLDARWSAATMRRDTTGAAHREYLESAALAATLTARTRTFAQAQEFVERISRAFTEAEKAHESALKNYDRARHETERAALTLVRERIASTKAQLENARERAANLSEEIARLDAVRERLREEFAAKAHLERLLETTEFMRDILKQAGPLVTESYLHHISNEANLLFREITGSTEATLRWMRDYEIVLEEGGYERSFQNLSGGEQMAAALAVRLALLKQLSDIRIAFFDEPTVNMDAERRARLAEQIGQVRHFDQLFVISHDDTFENAVDHVVYVKSSEK
jgi:exonuclease SbcC